ncbi:MAG: 4-hydroxy-tetrahydrodipicolinate reductase [Pseudomonadota bacterium]
MIKIGLHGSSGKMSREVAALIPDYPGCELTYQYSHIIDSAHSITALHSHHGNSLEELCKSSEVIIDFSNPAGLISLLESSMNNNIPVLIGTTGISSEVQEYIQKASKQTPILQAPNTSLGVNLLSNLVVIAAASLEDFDLEIIEMHHANKKDAPSGTALMLATEATNVRENKMVGFAPVRGGNLPGEHQVMFIGQNEVVTLVHRALSRKCYAEGAIKAARWLKDKEPGLYNMKDVLQGVVGGAARKN